MYEFLSQRMIDITVGELLIVMGIVSGGMFLKTKYWKV